MSKPNLQAVEKKISDEAKTIEQAKARIKRLNAQKSKLSRAERTRRLIVVGAVIVAKAEKEQDFRADLMNWLNDGLIAERDRALFDLAALPEGKNEPCPDQTQKPQPPTSQN